MEKAFDTKALLAELKGKGLDVAEELVEVLAVTVLEWTEKSVIIHPNPYVKFLAPVLGTVKPMILEAIDKIDGQVG